MSGLEKDLKNTGPEAKVYQTHWFSHLNDGKITDFLNYSMVFTNENRLILSSGCLSVQHF